MLFCFHCPLLGCGFLLFARAQYLFHWSLWSECEWMSEWVCAHLLFATQITVMHFLEIDFWLQSIFDECQVSGTYPIRHTTHTSKHNQTFSYTKQSISTWQNQFDYKNLLCNFSLQQNIPFSLVDLYLCFSFADFPPPLSTATPWHTFFSFFFLWVLFQHHRTEHNESVTCVMYVINKTMDLRPPSNVWLVCSMAYLLRKSNAKRWPTTPIHFRNNGMPMVQHQPMFDTLATMNSVWPTQCLSKKFDHQKRQIPISVMPLTCETIMKWNSII